MLCASVDEVVEAVVSNQRRFFDNVGDEPVLALLRSKLGPTYVDMICSALETTLRRSILFDLVTVQPFRAPVDLFFYRTPASSEPVSISFQVETRKMRAGLDLEGTPLDNFIRSVFDEHINDELVAMFNAAWGEIEREVLSTIYSAAVPPIIVRRCQLSEDIRGLCGSTHDAPANALLTSYSDFTWLYGQLKHRIEITGEVNFVDRPRLAGVLDGRVNLYADEYYPENLVLAIRRPKDNLDRTCMWSPFVFGGGLIACGAGVQNALALRSRQKITLLDTGFIAHGTLQ